MVKLIEMDERVTLRAQMQDEGGGPVVLINKFDVPPEGAALPHLFRRVAGAGICVA